MRKIGSLTSPSRWRLVAASFGCGLLAALAWTLSSGFVEPPLELHSNASYVAWDLPYRGLCQGVELQRNGQPVEVEALELGSGRARFRVPLTEGRHPLQLTFRGAVPGLQKRYPVTVVVDQTPPELSLEKLPGLDGRPWATVEDRLLVAGRTEPGVRLRLGEHEVELDERGRFRIERELPPGWSHLFLRAEDRAGNLTARKLSLFSDRRAPEVTWRTAPGQVFAEPRARLELSILDDGPLAGVNGQVDGRPVVWHRKSAERWVATTESLPEGRHTVEVKVADQAGRWSTSQRELVIDSSETLGEATLVVGARGADVVALHRRLREAGFGEGGLGSQFTAATREALRRFQDSEGLPVTGRADPATLVALGPRLLINLREFSLVLDRPGQPARRWAVASGTAEHPTPTGRFVVHEKVVDPTWLPPDSEWAKDAKPIEPGPDNPLGTRWIGFDWGGVGIHGTNAPWTVGSAASHGCLRMETGQVEELFELVEVGTPVIVFGGWENDPLLQTFWP